MKGLCQTNELFGIRVSKPQCVGSRHIDQKHRIVRVSCQCPFVAPDRFLVVSTIPSDLRLVNPDVWLVMRRWLTGAARSACGGALRVGPQALVDGRGLLVARFLVGFASHGCRRMRVKSTSGGVDLHPHCSSARQRLSSRELVKPAATDIAGEKLRAIKKRRAASGQPAAMLSIDISRTSRVADDVQGA